MEQTQEIEVVFLCAVRSRARRAPCKYQHHIDGNLRQLTNWRHFLEHGTEPALQILLPAHARKAHYLCRYLPMNTVHAKVKNGSHTCLYFREFDKRPFRKNANSIPFWG